MCPLGCKLCVLTKCTEMETPKGSHYDHDDCFTRWQCWWWLLSRGLVGGGGGGWGVGDGLCIWFRSRNCGCLVTWFCYQMIAKPGNKTATVPWPDPYLVGIQLTVPDRAITKPCCVSVFHLLDQWLVSRYQLLAATTMTPHSVMYILYWYGLKPCCGVQKCQWPVRQSGHACHYIWWSW